MASLTAERFYSRSALAQHRPNPLQRAQDARFKIVRMQAIQHQETANQLVPAHRIDQAGRGIAAASHNLEHALNTRPVKLHQTLDQFPGSAPGSRIGAGFQLLDQSLNAGHPVLEFLRYAHSN